MNKNIINFLNEYVKIPNPQYAIMLRGAWGCGKTFFIHQWMKQLSNNKDADKLEWQPIYVNLYKEYTSLKSRELEELPRFVVMIWQPFMLLRSASLCLFRITLCMQRYDFVSYKTKVS